MYIAPEMQFITVLSTPVGSLNRLEAVDYSAPAQGTTVNFCTKIGTGGKVQLKGNNNVDIENTNLSPNTTLGRSNAGDYVLQKITLNSAGELEGSRLLSKVVNVSGQGVGKSNNLYGTTLTVAGAKATTLNVNNGASQITAQHEAADMVWSNEYQKDKACGTNCAQQYLLKSKGGAVTGFQPVINIVQAAKTCGNWSRILYNGASWGNNDVIIDHTESRAQYTYAYSIEQTCDTETTREFIPTCGQCKKGMKVQGYTGDKKRCDTNYTNVYYDLQACPSGYSDEELCQQNCDASASTCSYRCLKTAANISGCGLTLETQRCYCPCPESNTACYAVTENPNQNPPDGSSQYEFYRSFEPKIGGTGSILTCVKPWYN